MVPDRLLSRPPLITPQSYAARDVILYALGVGVGIEKPDDAGALRYVYERRLVALPTMALVLAAPAFWLDDPALEIDWKLVLNAGQEMTLEAPLPVAGEVASELRIDALWDKGPAKGALMVSSRRLRDASGELIATIRQTHLLRGDGGFGGVDQPKTGAPPFPPRPPDFVVDLPTRPEQALLYRLTGDLNPLHIDPAVSAAAGFDRPILHGACSFGIACRAVLRAVLADETSRLRRFGARYARPVYPGDTIRTQIWRDGRLVQFRATALERAVLVLDQGFAATI